MKASLALLALLVAAAAAAACATATAAAAAALPRHELYEGLEHADVRRVVDLTTHVEEQRVEVAVRNAGQDKAAHYVVAVPERRVSHFSYVRVTSGGRELELERVQLAGQGVPEGAAFYRAELPEPLAPGAQADLKVLLVYTNTLPALPEAIGQDDDQLVNYEDSVYVFSPYRSASQVTRVRLQSDKVEYRTKKKPSKQTGDRLRYGPYEDVAAFAHKKLRVHYVNNAKFVTFRRVVRDIEVSHWGNVAVEEYVWVEHTGARLEGPFHRVTFEKGEGSQSSFNELVAQLPREARDVYYRDYIGNISDSHVRTDADHTRLELEPRFPLFGGWRTDFYTGFNVDAHNLLATDAADSSRFVLNTTFSTPFREAVVEELTLRVILPEGASDIELHVPFPVDSEERSVRKTYLDTVGRPMVVFHKTNLVHYHDDFFQVVYTFPARDMLIEPLMLTSIFFGVFSLAILYNRVNLSISPKAGKAE